MPVAEHIVCVGVDVTAFGVGFTITVAVTGVPSQPFECGVIVKVTVTGAEVVLVKLPLISPVPLSSIPVTSSVLSLDQLKVLPETLPDKEIVSMELPEQII